MTAPSAEVLYLWDGTKVRTSSALGQGRLYKGSFVYSVSPTGTHLESISHDEGRILVAAGASGTEFIDTWHVRDYLGSVRAIYDISTPAEEVEDASEHILEQNDYYAFGERIEVSGQAFDQTNRYRYNGKEQLRFESLNLDPGLTDYGARYYAPTFGRWASPDPLADKYYSISPYAFCNNNPVNYIDPDGRGIYSIDPDGKISKINDDEKVHQLHLVDKDGNITGKMIELSNSEAMEFLKYEKGKEIYSYTASEGNIDNVFKIFKFAANNTKVEWALHRGQGNVYTLGTSLDDSMVDSYFTMTGEESLPIASMHSHPNTTDITTMGYSSDTYSRSDQWKVNNSIAPKLNYVYFPKSRSLYLVGQYSPYYIRKIEAYQDFYFGTLNHR